VREGDEWRERVSGRRVNIGNDCGSSCHQSIAPPSHSPHTTHTLTAHPLHTLTTHPLHTHNSPHTLHTTYCTDEDLDIWYDYDEVRGTLRRKRCKCGCGEGGGIEEGGGCGEGGGRKRYKCGCGEEG